MSVIHNMSFCARFGEVFVDVNILLTTVRSTPLVHRSRDIFNRSINLCSKYQSPTVFDLGIEDGNTGQHP